MATITIDKPVERARYDDIRRLVDGPDPIKRGLFSKLADGVTRWADRYGAYELESPCLYDPRS